MDQKNQEVSNIKCIAHGAQAKLFVKEQVLQTGQIKKTIIKERLPKKYRHPILDEKLNQSRVKTQVKNLKKAMQLLVPVPLVYGVEKYSIFMQYIPGKTVKDYITELQKQEDPEKKQQNLKQIYKLLGIIAKILRKIHDNALIHGDLTTSNMIVQQYSDPPKVYLIDFGLSYIKDTIEDKAVDLYVLEKAFISTHPDLQKQFKEGLLNVYGQQFVLKRLQMVRQRGRKKVAFG